jgi:hypothetical protein
MPPEVLTLRQFVRLSESWPDELPGDGDTVVVAGMKGALEVLAHDQVISDNYFCRLATTIFAGGSAVRTACATVRS